MNKEETTITYSCDYCGSELEQVSNKLLRNTPPKYLRYEGFCYFIDGDPPIVCNESAGEWFDFCDEDCANKFLEKHHGFRFYNDGEYDCPKEITVGFCQTCPMFNNETKTCKDTSYWMTPEQKKAQGVEIDVP